ncbi:MAG: tyrosine-type recombinase/integrase [Dehalococcoidia bacterium]|nr:tyrosine-type recombinase/integrase [Dehalococcoidia bacterium]
MVQGDRLIKASRSTADRWIRAAKVKEEEAGAILMGRHISSHTLRHSYAMHLMMNGIPINYLSRWLGHSSIQTTLIYLGLCLIRQGV